MKNAVGKWWRKLSAALLAVLCGLWFGLFYGQAQQCDPTAVLSPALRNRPQDTNGIIHVTYSFADPNITAQERAAIENALTQ